MKSARRGSAPRSRPSGEVADLRARLDEAEETLHAIRTGGVDAVVVSGGKGPQVFTLKGAEHAYRVLIERMNEGALIVTPDKTILYANQRFARMVKRPLEQVTGGSLRRYLSEEDRAALRPLLKRTDKSGATIQATLIAGDGSRVAAQISVRPLPKMRQDRATVGVVVTDMTQARRAEERLRSLTQRVVQAQEAERGRVALELHDQITQLLCAALLQSQVLGKSLSAADGPAKEEAASLREMLGRAADEVERISRGLRPSVLDQLGLVAVLRSTTREFAVQSGATVKLARVTSTARLPADAELALYRVLQEALRNVDQHARARHVAVSLTQCGPFVDLSITDDGIGFDPDRRSARGSGERGLGLLGMRERIAYVGGALSIRSAVGEGTTIRARIPSGDGVAASTA